VLEAAGTKWNFLPFRPGLVGGHCIGVDPYYLTHKAQQIGYHPQVILAGRRINDGMGALRGRPGAQADDPQAASTRLGPRARAGLAFKENCPDLRNTRVVDVVGEFAQFPRQGRGLRSVGQRRGGQTRVRPRSPVDTLETGKYDAIVLAVAHRQFVEMGGERIRALGKPGCIVFRCEAGAATRMC
jgi:UDP-N-acetyl-D-galactosamine dehydrogenase